MYEATTTNSNQDYYATIYAAEIVNTLTNLLFISLAVKGVLNCYRHGHDQIFLITYAGYFCVGFGSLFFHATLKCMPSSLLVQADTELTPHQTPGNS